jgi:7-keto-8-aminopelargonate synthetase-like enzyme
VTTTLAMQMTRLMRERGVFLSVAAFPAVPRGKSRFRATVTAILEARALDRALTVNRHHRSREGDHLT